MSEASRISDDATPLDVLAFGEALVDFFPDAPGRRLAEVDVFHRQLGGAPCNVVVDLARQGVRAGLMTLVGPDDFGVFVRARLAAEGVDTAAVGTHASAKTGVTFVSVGTRGERSFLFFRHPSADQMIDRAHVADFGPRAIARARVFHFGSSTLSCEPCRSATLAALASAREAGLLISCDPNLRMHRWERADDARAYVLDTIVGCDLVKISDDELPHVFGTSDPDEGLRRLRAAGVGLAIVTLGERGCVWQGPRGGGAAPADRVEVVDTTGAGDAFVAGVLASLAPRFAEGQGIADLDETTVRAACVEGNRLGSLAVTCMGATTGVPKRG